MQSLALVIHVVLAVGVIGLVLMQHGKGADAGAAFGSGASATVFGASGSASFLTRMTTVLAVLFFITSLTLFYLAANRDRAASRSVTDIDAPAVVEDAPPAAELPAGDLPGGVADDVPAAPAAESATEAVEGAATDAVQEAAPAAADDLPQPAAGESDK